MAKPLDASTMLSALVIILTVGTAIGLLGHHASSINGVNGTSSNGTAGLKGANGTSPPHGANGITENGLNDNIAKGANGFSSHGTNGSNAATKPKSGMFY